jgi:hypothetical protein
MYAVFNKNEFKGLWHNQPSDEGWLARTCQGKGWNPGETVAYWYGYNFSSQTVYIFDADKKLLIQGEVTKNIEIAGQLQEVKVWETVETWTGSLLTT